MTTTSPPLYLKKGDTGTATAPLTDITGAVVNLTGASVDFLMRITSYVGPRPAPKVDAAASIVGSPTLGVVSYTLGPNDTDEIGTYWVEWKVTFGGGAIQRFNGDGYDRVVVVDNLDGP